MNEFYSNITRKNEIECKRELALINIEFYGDDVQRHSQIQRYMSKENVIEIQRRKEDVKWDFAWSVFDQINQGLGLNN